MVFGSSWSILEVLGGFASYLELFKGYWRFLEVLGGFMRFLEVHRRSWRLLKGSWRVMEGI